MASKFGTIQTQKQSEAVPQAAFGDYRGLQGIAQGIDAVAQLGNILEKKKEARDITAFKLQSRQFLEEQKQQGLGGKELTDNYTKWFNEEVEKFPDQKEKLMQDVYFRSLDSSHVKSYILQKEHDEVKVIADEVADNHTNAIVIGERDSTLESLQEFHEDAKNIEAASPAQKNKIEALMAQTEVFYLAEADSLEEFDKMVPALMYLQREPVKIRQLREQLESDLRTTENGLKAKTSQELRNHVSQLGTIDFHHTEEDLVTEEGFAEAAASGMYDADDLQLMHHGNALVMLKMNSHMPREFFGEMASHKDVADFFAKMDVSDEVFEQMFKDKTQINNFVNLANKLKEMPDADRLARHPMIRKHIAKGKDGMYMATHLTMTLMGEYDEEKHGPDGMKLDKKDFWGKDATYILDNMWSQDLFNTYSEAIDPTKHDADTIIAAKLEIDRKLGPVMSPHFHNAFTAYAIKGKGVEGELAAYNALVEIGGTNSIDVLYGGMTTQITGKYLEDKGIDNAEKTLRDKITSSEGVMRWWTHMQDMGNPTEYEDFIGLLVKSGLAQFDNNSNMTLSKAAKNVIKAVNDEHFLIDSDSLDEPILLSHEYDFKGRGLDEWFGTAWTVLSSVWDEDAEEKGQERRLRKAIEQAIENPLARSEYRATGPVDFFMRPYPAILQDAGTAFLNVRKQVQSIPVGVSRAVTGQNPFTIYNAKKYHWFGAPDDNVNRMYQRVNEGTFFSKPRVKFKQVIGPKGEIGFHVFAQSINDDGDKTGLYDAPLMDRASGKIAFISLTELAQKDQFFASQELENNDAVESIESTEAYRNAGPSFSAPTE